MAPDAILLLVSTNPVLTMGPLLPDTADTHAHTDAKPRCQR